MPGCRRGPSRLISMCASAVRSVSTSAWPCAGTRNAHAVELARATASPPRLPRPAASKLGARSSRRRRSSGATRSISRVSPGASCDPVQQRARREAGRRPRRSRHRAKRAVGADASATMPASNGVTKPQVGRLQRAQPRLAVDAKRCRPSMASIANRTDAAGGVQELARRIDLQRPHRQRQRVVASLRAGIAQAIARDQLRARGRALARRR